jgi:hypothetical protein
MTRYEKELGEQEQENEQDTQDNTYEVPSETLERTCQHFLWISETA